MGGESGDSGVGAGLARKKMRMVEGMGSEACADWAKWEHKQMVSVASEIMEDWDNRYVDPDLLDLKHC